MRYPALREPVGYTLGNNVRAWYSDPTIKILTDITVATLRKGHVRYPARESPLLPGTELVSRVYSIELSLSDKVSVSPLNLNTAATTATLHRWSPRLPCDVGYPARGSRVRPGARVTTATLHTVTCAARR